MKSHSARRAVRRILTAVENLENRLCFDATPQALPFAQNWTNVNQITTNNDWSGVPGFVGYRGDDITPSTGVDPQTLVGEGTVVINVTAQHVVSNISGGLGEFELADPVVGFQGSGTADAPNLVAHLNTTGVNTVRVSYNLRDIDDTLDNAVQPVALQYRVGSSGDFINVPMAFVADASTGPSTATLVTPVSVTLPSEAGNQALVQVRWITANAIGNDEWIGIDDIRFESAVGPGSFSFQSSPYTENEAIGMRTITVTRSGGTTGAASVRVRTLGGTATPTADYTPVDQVLNFADGVSSQTFILNIVNDTMQEPTETIGLNLSAATGGATISQTDTTFTILDNDATVPAGVVLNELDVNPPGDDGPFEYVEVRGGNGQGLAGVYFVSIEGDDPNAGNATFVQSLTDFALGSNGLLVIKASVGGFTIPAGTTVVGATAFNAVGGALQNGSNSFALIFSQQNVIASGQDLDTNNDGFLDLPAGATLIDAVGWLDGGASDIAYGAVLTQPMFQPQAATRFPNDLTPQSVAAWYNGNILADNGQMSLNYDPANSSANLPPGGMLTPGAANFPQTGDTTPPTITGTAFVFDAFPTRQTITVDFSENVLASLAVSDFVLTRTFNMVNTIIPSSDIALAYATGTDIASLTFPNYSPNGSLPDGDYELFLGAGTVEDAAGNDLATSLNFEFFAFAGDATRDRAVNISDFSILASNFNTPGTFTDGDFNYTGQVEIGDFSILASKFNTVLNPGGRPGGAALAVKASQAALFSTREIDSVGDSVLA